MGKIIRARRWSLEQRKKELEKMIERFPNSEQYDNRVIELANINAELEEDKDD